MQALPHLFATDSSGKPHSGTQQHCESLMAALRREGKFPYLVPSGAGLYQIGLAKSQKDVQLIERYLASQEAVKLPHQGLRFTKLIPPGAC